MAIKAGSSTDTPLALILTRLPMKVFLSVAIATKISFMSNIAAMSSPLMRGQCLLSIILPIVHSSSISKLSEMDHSSLCLLFIIFWQTGEILSSFTSRNIHSSHSWDGSFLDDRDHSVDIGSKGMVTITAFVRGGV